MRFLDLAVAAVIGLGTVALLSAWGPSYSDHAALQLRQATLDRDRLLGVANRLGVVWMQDASLRDLCSSLAALSNSSLTISAAVNGVRCRASPGVSSISANLTFVFTSRVVVLQAWSPGLA